MSDFYNSPLSTEQKKFILSFGKAQVIPNTTLLIYSQHIPSFSFVLQSGQVNIRNNKDQIIQSYKDDAIIGIKECLHGLPMDKGVEVLADSIITVLDKSTLKQIIQQNDLLLKYFD